MQCSNTRKGEGAARKRNTSSDSLHPGIPDPSSSISNDMFPPVALPESRRGVVGIPLFALTLNTLIEYKMKHSGQHQVSPFSSQGTPDSAITQLMCLCSSVKLAECMISGL